MLEPDQLPQHLATRWTLRDAGTEVSRIALERLTRVYIELARRRNDHRVLLDSSTDLLIEGFPRSGNTYLLSWVTLANPGIKVASHLHSVAHIRAALRRGVPVIVLLRNPRDAIASEGAYLLGLHESVSLPKLISRYERFYTYVASRADDLVVSPFEATTSTPALVVHALNELAGSRLKTEPPGEERDVLEDVERLNALSKGQDNELTVARPSAARSDLAARIKADLAEHQSRRLVRLEDLHDRLASGSSAVR